jgi:hypothetical protein
MATKRSYPEARLQQAVVQHLRLAAWSDVVFFHPANEGRRSLKTGAYLKSLGMLPGVADLVICHEGRTYFLELKSPRGRMSASQLAFEEAIYDAGFDYDVADDIYEAVDILETWGVIKRTVRT